jgi:4,5-dihydroxyphthalate decarboxylase
MARIALTLACRDYDHTRDLFDGKVAIDGIDLRCVSISPPSQIFLRMLRNEEFDASEMSLSNYMIALDSGDRRFVAIPVFPARVFRHSNIWVNVGAGVSEPRDLIGKRVGIPDYSMTALLFVRGLLKHQYGVMPEDIFWFRSRSEHVSTRIPASVRLENIPKGQMLDRMLEEGKLDAIVATSLPGTVKSGSNVVKRLFENAREVEAEYFRQTRIFPIMHIVVIRRAIYEQNRWLAVSLAKAFETAKQRTYQRYEESLYPLPWISLDYEFAQRMMGNDIFPYGIKRNLPTLEAATLYSLEQGLTERRIELNEIFAPETWELFGDSSQ